MELAQHWWKNSVSVALLTAAAVADRVWDDKGASDHCAGCSHACIAVGTLGDGAPLGASSTLGDASS
jgi:hypothetical protein